MQSTLISKHKVRKMKYRITQPFLLSATFELSWPFPLNKKLIPLINWSLKWNEILSLAPEVKNIDPILKALEEILKAYKYRYPFQREVHMN